MAGDDLRRAGFVQIGAQPQPQRLHAVEVDLFAEQPARVVFAKAVGGDQGKVLEIESVGLQIAARLGHGIPVVERPVV